MSRRTKKTISMDLTALLDVILIMLFLVLMQSEARIENIYYDVREDFEQQFAEELEELRQTSHDMTTLQLGLEEDTGVIIITLEPMATGTLNRIITVEADTTTQIVINWDRGIRDVAARELNAALVDAVRNSNHAFSFIIFRYDSSLIYDDDRMFIRLAIHNHQ